MKKIFIFLILIVLSFCHLDKAKKEELKQRRRESNKFLAECLLKNEKTSEKLKQEIKDTPEDNIENVIYHRHHELDKKDIDIIRQCRRESVKIRNEEHKKVRQTKMQENKTSDL